jgi:ketosteroid isomerase-like protein
MYTAAVETRLPVAAQLRALLFEIAEAYYDQDLPRLLANYAPDDQTVLLGNTAKERLVGLNEIRRGFQRDFATAGRVCLEYGWTSISTHDDTAWIAAECLIHRIVEGEEVSRPGRLTLVCENRDGRWLIVQQHFSLLPAV